MARPHCSALSLRVLISCAAQLCSTLLLSHAGRAEGKGPQESPEFQTIGETWRLRAYPNGDLSSSGCLSVYLQLRGQGGAESLRCQYRMRVLHPCNAETAWISYVRNFEREGLRHGYSVLLQPEQIAKYCHRGWAAVQVCAWERPLTEEEKKAEEEKKEKEKRETEQKEEEQRKKRKREEEEEQKEKEPAASCIVCMDAPPSALSPCCNSLRLCDDCMRTVISKPLPDCPSCRQRIVKGKVIFSIRQ